MRFERVAAQVGLLAMAVSASNAGLRRTEEKLRRAAVPAVRLVDDGHGREVECVVSFADDRSRPVVIFETGLGGSIDNWDWFQVAMSGGPHARALLPSWPRPDHLTTASGCAPGADPGGGGPRGEGGAPGRPFPRRFGDRQLPPGGAILAARVSSVTLIDSTDADLLGEERGQPGEVRRFRQYCFQEGLASLTGLGRWTGSPVDAEVNLRASSQKAFMTESSRPRTLVAAVREHALEPLSGQAHLATLPIAKWVVAASDNVVQQRRLAEKLGAELLVVADSSHRSIIGRHEPANTVVRHLRLVIS